MIEKNISSFIDTKSNNHNCCTPQPKGKQECPQCKEKAKGVLSKTLQYILIDERKEKLSCFEGFYYCKTSSCNVVYFRDTEILTQKDLKVMVGLKDGANPATTCYCFGWTKEKIYTQLQENGTTTALEDIKYKMNTLGCSCEILNPNGGCCLADNSKVISEMKKKMNIAKIVVS